VSILSLTVKTQAVDSQIRTSFGRRQQNDAYNRTKPGHSDAYVAPEVFL
jgi:hypothetical protein